MFSKIFAKRKARLKVKDYNDWLRRYKRALRAADYNKIDKLIDIAVYYRYAIPGKGKNHIIDAFIRKHEKSHEMMKAREGK